MARTALKSIRQVQNEIFDLLKFSAEQRAEAVETVEYEDTKVFVANPKAELDDLGQVFFSETKVSLH